MFRAQTFSMKRFWDLPEVGSDDKQPCGAPRRLRWKMSLTLAVESLSLSRRLCESKIDDSWRQVETAKHWKWRRNENDKKHSQFYVANDFTSHCECIFITYATSQNPFYSSQRRMSLCIIKLNCEFVDFLCVLLHLIYSYDIFFSSIRSEDETECECEYESILRLFIFAWDWMIHQ